MVAVPREVVASARQHPLLRGLLPTKIGFFPEAEDHLHECKERVDHTGFMYCSKGRGWCELRGQRHEVQAGMLMISPSNEVYAHGADTNDPWTVSWFQVVGEDVSPILGELGTTLDNPVVPLPQNPQWQSLFEESLATLERGYTPAHLIHSAHTLGHLLSALLWQRHQHPGQPDPGARIAHCIEFMKRNLDQPLRLPMLAAMAGMSPARFKQHFKQHTGYPCIEYFIRLRMQQACRLLDTTDLSVKAIADHVGYADPLWFSKAFRAVTHLPPSAYRQRSAS